MKKIIKHISYGIAWGPAFIVISSLISVLLILPVTLLPSTQIINFGTFEISLRLFIVEIIMLILLGVYGYRVCSKIQDNSVAKLLYWGFFISGMVTFFFRSQVVLLQPILPILYAINFERQAHKIKSFLQASCYMFVALNIYDVLYIFALKWIMQIEDRQLTWIIWVSVIFFLLVVTILRTLLLKIYIKQNEIDKRDRQEGYSQFSFYAIMFVASFIQLILYISMFISYTESKDSSLINLLSVYAILMTISIYYWSLLKEQIDRGGITHKKEILRWSLGILVLLFIFLYDRLEGEFIGILSWLLPILISTIIGGIHYQFILNEHQQLLIPTIKMKQHMYRLQLVSFLMLTFLNLFSALFTIQRVENDRIIRLNTVKIEIINLINSTNKHASSDFMSSFTTSFIVVAISFILAIMLSETGIKLLKMHYLDLSKGYYKSYNSVPNRRYKGNIHKRRN
ncbi:hypothetical protein ACVRYP_06920 [Streptococcus rifensis]